MGWEARGVGGFLVGTRFPRCCFCLLSGQGSLLPSGQAPCCWTTGGSCGPATYQAWSRSLRWCRFLDLEASRLAFLLLLQAVVLLSLLLMILPFRLPSRPAVSGPLVCQFCESDFLTEEDLRCYATSQRAKCTSLRRPRVAAALLAARASRRAALRACMSSRNRPTLTRANSAEEAPGVASARVCGAKLAAAFTSGDSAKLAAALACGSEFCS